MRSEGGVVYLTSTEMAEFDRTAIEDFGISETILMENAGVAVAGVARQMLGGRVEGRSVSIMVGKGNNGGDGLVAGRHLRNWGGHVSVLLAEGRPRRTEPAGQLAILDKMGVAPSGPETSLEGADLVIDALLGYNVRGDPREPLAGMIRRANSSRARVLAVDIPSGLDASTGAAGDPCVIADTTVTFGLPKTGFLSPGAGRFVGALLLADISFPASAYERYSQGAGIFRDGPLVRIR